MGQKDNCGSTEHSYFSQPGIALKWLFSSKFKARTPKSAILRAWCNTHFITTSDPKACMFFLFKIAAQAIYRSDLQLNLQDFDYDDAGAKNYCS